MWYTCTKTFDVGPTIISTTEKVWKFITAKEAREKTDQKTEEQKKLASDFLPTIEEKILEVLNAKEPCDSVWFEIPEGTTSATCQGLYEVLKENGYNIYMCGAHGFTVCQSFATSGHWNIGW